ncbi:phenylalanine--tRNA ligase subunit beta [Candidatus Riesia pediculicola]|uniref:Phenylalanine--tRNA ligase beta subunit n=1 Tax=Riesia pediculicola (strain USDA) TaxID=515618 RepID=D4G7R0_RIEPU|nr:phenylalanine--tRNA ligase subunit beta [Candidatus Riesia pediculicola]ADD79548.1 phenylalanyl-tRNA synthetase, beta subunit [Candidatus Riesia pediculicola USDA]QOJ86284.1 phenylalanine--tRNA ligase subunit beta [Candidatus Riesia pediculicola]
MKFDETWIKEWIDFEIDSESLLEQITRIGIEVNKIFPREKYLENMIVGKIVKISECFENKIPSKVLTVDIGKKLLKIFCNSLNSRLNMKVAVSIQKSYSIKNKKKREQISEACLCRYNQIFFLKENRNIVEIPKNFSIGSKIGKHLIQYYQRTFDSSSVSNRKDFDYIFGIYRDIAAINRKKISFQKNKIKKNRKISHSSHVKLNITEPKYCPYIFSRVIKKVDVGIKTPDWMIERLSWNDVVTTNPINNIKNYVKLETGYSIFAYDFEKIRGSITIRRSKKNESIFLKEKKIDLLQNTLVISDEKSIISIIGITDNERFKIQKNTSNILLICAIFDFNLFSNSLNEYQYVYGLSSKVNESQEKDSNMLLNTIERTSELITKICGGEVGKIIKFIYEDQCLKESRKIVLKLKKIHQTIGHRLSYKKISEILIHLGFKILSDSNYDQLEIKIPSWRKDVSIEEDIIDEIIRIYGYNNFPKESSRNLQINSKVINNQRDLSMMDILYLLKRSLACLGYHEIITYSFINEKLQNLLFFNQNYIELPHPISSKMSVMRTSLIPGILSAVQYNQRRQNDQIKIFESGYTFFLKKNSSADSHQTKVTQKLMLSAAIVDQKERSWFQENRKIDFFDIKGDLESILCSIKSDRKHFLFKKNLYYPIFDKEQSAEIYLDDKFFGIIGVIHKRIKEQLEIRKKIFVFEIIIENLLLNKDLFSIKKYKEISKFPMNQRDISMIFREEIPVSEILSECRRVSSFLLKKKIEVSSKIFDIYQGKSIKNGYRSISINFTIQNSQKTMREHEISNVVEIFINEMKKKFFAILREK